MSPPARSATDSRPAVSDLLVDYEPLRKVDMNDFTTQMAYSTEAYQIAYFAKNEWAETPSQMIQPLIVKTPYRDPTQLVQ